LRRDVYYYLEQKAKPRLQTLQRLADLAPILAQFERGELQAGGFFSVVLGAFTRPAEESAVNVRTSCHDLSACIACRDDGVSQ
jgi:hypothetical protein